MDKKVIPANNIKFEKLCDLLEKLNRSKKQRKELDTLADFFNEYKLTASQTVGNKDPSIFPILRLILPKLDRERAAYNLKETKLGTLLVKVLSLPKQSRDAQKLLNFRSVSNTSESDFAGIAYFVIKNRRNATSDTFTVGDINNILDRISSAEAGNKSAVLDETFSYVVNKLNPEQLKWFLRIILKDLKLGISSNRMLALFHPDAPEYYENCGDLSKVCEELGEGDARPLELGIQMFSAVSPMLSERLDVKHIGKLAADAQYVIENKFDGERFQIHMENGVFEYFSRRGHKYSSNYGKSYDSGLLTPCLKDCLAPKVKSFILDGEMMGWHKEYQCFSCKGVAFDVKKITVNSRYRPCFCVFDILYYNGRTLVGPPDKGGLPLNERLKILNDVFTNVTGVIQHSVRQPVIQRSDILNALNKAIENQDEGIVVKDVASYYIPNKRNVGWYKIKPEYSDGTMDDLDLVIIGADEAENKDQGRAKSFLVACSDGGGYGKMPDRWVGVGRVASGLSFESRAGLCATLERHWTSFKSKPPPENLVFNKEKPDFWILPEHSVVLTVRATELIRSTDYGAGYTLRFPRVKRVRDDKPVRDIMTLDELYKFISDKGGASVVKLSTNQIGEDEIGTETKVTRKRKTEAPKVADKFLVTSCGEVEATSQALQGRKICILSDDDDCKQPDLAKIVESHGGTVVANDGSDTWVCIAGRMTKRVRDLTSARCVDVTSTAWLRSLAPSNTPADLHPLHMLSVKTATRLALARNYDQFGDAYTELIDENTLKRCFDKMSSDHDPIYLTTQEMLNVDKELFGDSNPFSFLRPCHICFTNRDSINITLANMYGAHVSYDLSNKEYTHIVVSNITNSDVVEDIKRQSKALVVSEDWLETCFLNKELV